MDIQVDDQGRIYVLELSHGDGFPDVGRGRIVRITGLVAEEIVTGLSVPTGMTQDRFGDIYVSDLGADTAGSWSYPSLRQSDLRTRGHHHRSPLAGSLAGPRIKRQMTTIANNSRGPSRLRLGHLCFG